MGVRLLTIAWLAWSTFPLHAQSQAACPVSIPNNRKYTGAELAPLVVGNRRSSAELKATTQFLWPLGNHGNNFHSVDLPPNGKIGFKVSDRLPANAVDLTEAPPLPLRLSWWRLVKGELTFEGRPFGGGVQALPSSASTGYGDIGFQPVSVKLPSVGCWEITGRAGGKSLTFVIDVVKVTEWSKSDQQ
jgi:hypothetical protein